MEYSAENWAPSEISKLGLSLRGLAIFPSFVREKSVFAFQLKGFNDVENTCGKDQGDHLEEPSNLQHTRKE